MWETHYVSDNPRFKNSSPRIAWCDLWKRMDGLIEKAQLEIRILETNENKTSTNMFATMGGDRFGLPNVDKSNCSSMYLGGSAGDSFSDQKQLSKMFQDTAMKRFTAYGSERNNKNDSSKTYDDQLKKPPSNTFDSSSYNKDSSPNRCIPRFLKGMYHNSTLMNRMQQNAGGEMHLPDGMNNDALAIPTDELNEAHIAVLQEKLSGFKREVLSAQHETTDYRLQADACVKTILKLNKLNDDLEVKNRELERKLAESHIREGGLRDTLYRYENKAKQLQCTTQGTQAYQHDLDKKEDAACRKRERDSSIAELEAENKRLKEEIDALKESARRESENDEGDYLLI